MSERWLTEEQIAQHEAKMRDYRNGGAAGNLPLVKVGPTSAYVEPSKAVPPTPKRKHYPIAELCLQHGLLMPVKEHRFAQELGREWRFDFAWPSVKLYLEVDGGIWVDGGHNRGKFMLSTFEKRNTATRLGWRGLWYAPESLGAAIDDLRALLPTVD